MLFNHFSAYWSFWVALIVSLVCFQWIEDCRVFIMPIRFIYDGGLTSLEGIVCAQHVCVVCIGGNGTIVCESTVLLPIIPVCAWTFCIMVICEETM